MRFVEGENKKKRNVFPLCLVAATGIEPVTSRV